MDLAEETKNYTAKEINEYKELTIILRDHSLKMLENDTMPDHLRLAVQMSIKQAEDDLEILAKAMDDRKAKIGETAFQKELSAPNDHSGQLDSEDTE